MKKLHLICNAHLDPVWLWEWEEGAAEAISTFRTAADLCEEFDGFVFNHNEVVLYQWVEEYEPALFKRIQQLVKKGRWHIMGGWYLQPDCNMPSGESFVRQILLGRSYFKDKFGVAPKVAINFDPFGHSRGLVQTMAKSGYIGYLFCRPDQGFCKMDGDEFVWEGFDGSRVLGFRASAFYNAPLGKAREKVEKYLSDNKAKNLGLVLWGVGNHGGGPSRKDIRDLNELIQKTSVETDIRHSTPEDYFKELNAAVKSLPVRRQDLNPWGVGCYTSQIRIKQKHRLLENELYATEKMCSAAWVKNVMPYPSEELKSALKDLALSEFHDILPGSSIQPVEEMAFRVMDHGLETISRIKARAFFALAGGEHKAEEGEIPILVYNPHPYPVETIVECEFQLADFNWSGTFTQVTVHQGTQGLPTQVEKELSNLSLDWRKRVVFQATLQPSQMNRFDCKLKRIPAKPAPELAIRDNSIRFSNGLLEARISATTGLLEMVSIGGKDYLGAGAFQALVLQDNEDPWNTQTRKFGPVVGRFELMTEEESAAFSGVWAKTLAPVRVIEDGPVRSVVEAVFKYGISALCLHYKLPKQGSEIEINVRAYWHEKDRMLKLTLPCAGNTEQLLGQTAFGVQPLAMNGDENVSQKWMAVVSESDKQALTIINDGLYGSSFENNELRVSLIRSPAYSGHPIENKPIVPQDRLSPRIDQGERFFRFWLNGGPVEKRLATVDREALCHNEKSMALSFFPSGKGIKQSEPFIEIKNSTIQISAIKKSEDGKELVVRLYEPTGSPQKASLKVPCMGASKTVQLKGFEVRTYRLNIKKKEWTETDLMEKPL